MTTGQRYTGTHFGVFKVISGPKGIYLNAAEFDPEPTEMMASLEQSVTSPLRIQKPSIRKGYLENGPASRATRGDEPFVEVDWDLALDLASTGLNRTYADHGPQAVYGGSYGWASAGRFHHAQSQIHRFLNILGGYTASVNTYSHAAAEVLLPHIVGSEDDIMYSGTTWPVIRDHTRLILAFGGLPSLTGQVSPGGVSAHTSAGYVRSLKQNGIKVITIGPMRRGHDADLDSTWIRARPNTDTALMLGIAFHLFATKNHDQEFLDQYTVGFEKFLAYLLGQVDSQPKTPEWAARICGIQQQVIIDLAEVLPQQRSLLTATWALQRADHGEQPFWMLITLAAMLGQIGLPGGGFSFGLSSFNGVANPVDRRRFAAFPQGHNPVRQRIPVARITELLENPGGRIDYDGQVITMPDIRAIYWAGGNPFHHHQDLGRLRRAWKAPDLVIVNDLEWSATARHADIVFPVASVLERNDIMAANSDSRIVAMRKCTEPVGQSKSDYEIFSALADRFDKRAAFTEGRDEMAWLRWMYEKSQIAFRSKGVELPEFDRFWQEGTFQHGNSDAERVLLGPFRANPAKHRLPTPSGRIEIFSEKIASFGYADCPGHACWIPPRDWLGSDRAAVFPLHLISPQPGSRLHGQLDGNGPSAASKIKGREPAFLNAFEAGRREIKNGDVIRIFNEIGALLAGAQVVDWIADGVIALPTGAWFSPTESPGLTCAHGNPNAVTADLGTSRLSQGPSPNSTLVEVEAVHGFVPEVDVHLPPQFAQYLDVIT